MTSVESFGDAVELGKPRMSARNETPWDDMAAVRIERIVREKLNRM